MLHTHLVYNKDNKQRKDFVMLHNNRILASQIPTKTALADGALAFESFYIEYTYRNYPLRPERSTLYMEIKPRLAHFTMEEKFCLLKDFYNYLVAHQDSCLVHNLYWVDMEKLIKEVGRIVMYVMYTKLEIPLKHLLEDPPDPISTERLLNDVLIKYRALLKARNGLFYGYGLWSNSSWTDLLEFCELINSDIQRIYSNAHEALSVVRLEADLIRQGLLCLIILEINGGQWVFSAQPIRIAGQKLKGSDFYELAMIAINHFHLTVEQVILRLESLEHFVRDVTKQIQNHPQASLIAKYEIQLNKHLQGKRKERDEPSFSQYCLKTLISKGAQYGIAFAASKGLIVLAKKVILPKLQSTLANSVCSSVIGPAGPVAYAIFGSVNLLIGDQVSQMVSEQIIPAAMATLYSKVLDMIGTAIAGSVAGVIVIGFNTSKEGLRNLLGFYNEIAVDVADKERMRKLAKSCLDLPEHIFSQSKKDILLQYRDLEEPKKLTL